MAILKVMKPHTRSGATLIENNGAVMTVKDGNVRDSHFISPETDPERLRIVGAVGEMLFEEAKKSFGIESLLVIAQNDDFRIAMFPENGGFAVWKTNLEIDEIVHEITRGRDDRRRMARDV
jgi:hypothetical protein